MKKTLFVFVLSLVLGIGNIAAQTAEPKPFEGEIVQKMNSYQKVKTKIMSKNLLVKMIAGSIVKKYVDNNPDYYNGICTSTFVVKGVKTREHHSGKNRVTITLPEDGRTKFMVYYPYIKKGYYYYIANESKKELEANGVKINQSQIEKTGEMTVDGHKCDVYKTKFDMESNEGGAHNVGNVHCEWAVCQGFVTGEGYALPGVKGMVLKSTINVVSQATSKEMNMDLRFNFASTLEKMTERAVADSEFEVPAEIKMVDIEKKPKEMLKIIQENAKYLKKKGLWVEAPDEAPKIYDNLAEDWDY